MNIVVFGSFSNEPKASLYAVIINICQHNDTIFSIFDLIFFDKFFK